MLVLLAVLSLVIYRATEPEVVGSFSDHQLGVARTLAVAVEADIRALGSSLRQLNTLPSVRGGLSASIFGSSRRDTALLQKPFPPAVLTRAVRLVLDRIA